MRRGGTSSPHNRSPPPPPSRAYGRIVWKKKITPWRFSRASPHSPTGLLPAPSHSFIVQTSLISHLYTSRLSKLFFFFGHMDSKPFLSQFWKVTTYQHPSESYREEDVLVWFQREATPLEKKRAVRNTSFSQAPFL